MPGALKEIVSNYGRFSKEAKRLFAEKLAFDVCWPLVFEKLSDIL